MITTHPIEGEEIPALVIRLDQLSPRDLVNRTIVAAYAAVIFQESPDDADRLYKILDDGLHK